MYKWFYYSNWNIPKVSPKEIYRKRKSISYFKVNIILKQVEQVYAIRKHHETCQLLNTKSIKKYRKDSHNFLHIGLVQIQIKPLTRRGLNASVSLYLRYARFTNFNNSA